MGRGLRSESFQREFVRRRAIKLIERPLQHPGRTMYGFQPLKAFRHFRKLVADKEDTEQVFHIIEATAGRKSAQQAAQFVRSQDGLALLEKASDLPSMLDNHDRWADCGENSVAQHYIRFMKREGLTAAGLVAESHKWLPPEKRHADLYEWYFERLRDTLDGCIGCGCLSLQRCALYNPDDRAAGLGAGPRWLLGDSSADA